MSYYELFAVKGDFRIKYTDGVKGLLQSALCLLW